LYFHRWDPVALCHNRRVDLSRFSSSCGPFMDSSVTSDGNLCLLAGYPGIFALDFRASDGQIRDMSAGLNFPRKINCVQFSRSGEQFAITHDNPSCCLSVFDLRKFNEPLYSDKIDDKLGTKRLKIDFDYLSTEKQAERQNFRSNLRQVT
jgi:hypothetical protein